MTRSSSSAKTFPAGLFGVFSMIALVRELKDFLSSSSLNRKSGARSATWRGLAPAIIVAGT